MLRTHKVGLAALVGLTLVVSACSSSNSGSGNFGGDLSRVICRQPERECQRHRRRIQFRGRQ